MILLLLLLLRVFTSCGRENERTSICPVCSDHLNMVSASLLCIMSTLYQYALENNLHNTGETDDNNPNNTEETGDNNSNNTEEIGNFNNNEETDDNNSNNTEETDNNFSILQPKVTLGGILTIMCFLLTIMCFFYLYIRIEYDLKPEIQRQGDIRDGAISSLFENWNKKFQEIEKVLRTTKWAMLGPSIVAIVKALATSDWSFSTDYDFIRNFFFSSFAEPAGKTL